MMTERVEFADISRGCWGVEGKRGNGKLGWLEMGENAPILRWGKRTVLCRGVG